MSKRAFDKMAAGLAAAISYADGSADRSAFRVHVPPQVEVKAIRGKLGLGQEAFAARYEPNSGLGAEPLADDASSRILLIAIDKEPEAIDRALAAA
jgi:putative transcriptional regulator